MGEYMGTTVGFIKGDTRSLDIGSYGIVCWDIGVIQGFGV